ncbi:hypothetical protein JNUCC0626_32940 [Lentzea sp. JNUCC 0626]|uniref:hypothetical protein n=1 Tax=Lentzea sp. JNUCC 0626 TaxID=3367513 RepID=UPI00374866F2
MRIEDELRGALDVPAPPPVTQLEDVLKLGRREVAVRRAGITGSVLAVVAVIALGAVVWPFGSRGGTDPLNWARAPQPQEQVADPPRDSRACSENSNPPPTSSPAGEILARAQTDVWLDLVHAALPNRRVEQRFVEEGLARAFTVDVGTTATVRFVRVRFDGLTPSAAADQALWATGGCAPPRRTTNADGTVFQLYDAAPTGQALYVFRADGRSVRIEQTSVTAEAGSLPLGEGDFVKLGAAVAEVL